MSNPKFRVYDKKKKEWLLDYKQSGGFSLIGEIMLFEEWARILQERMEWLNELDIMQSTGLKDNAGIEIYEGDVLLLKNGTRLVYWDNQYAGFYPFSEYGAFRYTKDYKIIGNVWDNPELLNK